MTSTVSFALPPANEATAPPERRGLTRDGVRLLVTAVEARTQHHATFRDLPLFLRPGDLVVANDSATIPAALVAHRNDGTTFALHLSTRVSDDLWIAEPRQPVTEGERALLAEGGTATFLAPVDATHHRLWYVLLSVEQPLEAFLTRNGAPIRYRYVSESFPLADYQTVFARVPGSAEMPSAGRPFTPHILNDLRSRGIELATITLHTGVSSPERHERPYHEWFEVSAATAAAVNATRLRGGRVIAIGTTVVRALESSVADGETIAATGWTDLIVTPERSVESVDGLLTGFHEPEASHLDMLRAFTDAPLLERAYDEAIGAGYLWHEFGDVHLIVP
ncbi:MAG TPA: S-adenosylmethionine:tRNA ribosyltransferase-isomerase [Candidatus Elarobacter sp.]|jgi:S-adenosylmethionine:tRNA ribosyltransferase-isomerase|nr:S-adenosylmethionine:tRNA ribosyltransferase-isomerase [Candidatus Elarobacter sp.]